MGYNLPDRVLKDIRIIACRHNIDKVILFGSRARGNYVDRSDIDLAVAGGDFDSFYWDINENVHSLLTFDLVKLEQNGSEELKEEIEKDGITIYEKA
ncbi:MAG: nucleotidyltransferase domain-containing protein [Eubacterium sp.]|nr:nucleotidyltransferase domain-containing protein [Eubacterium sp.]